MRKISSMKKRRMLLLAAFAVIASVARVGYKPLEWGGYWYVDFALPWQR